MLYFINVYWQYFYFNLSGFVSDSALIPRKPKDKDCREGTPPYLDDQDLTNGDYIYRCYCEEHCVWAKCRLVEAPDECLIGTNSIWMWDSQKQYWVAQVSNGNIY